MTDTFPPPDAPPPEDPSRVQLPPPPQMPAAAPSLPPPPATPWTAGPPPSTPPPVRYDDPTGPPSAWAPSPIPAPPPYQPPPPRRRRLLTFALVITLLMLGVLALLMTANGDGDGDGDGYEGGRPSESGVHVPQRAMSGDALAMERVITNATLAYSRKDYAELARLYFSNDSQALCGGPTSLAEAIAGVHDALGPNTVEFDRIVRFDGSEVEFRAIVTEPGLDTPSTMTYGVPVIFEDGDWRLATQWPPLVADVCGGSFAVEANQDGFGEEGRVWPFTVHAAWFSCWEDGTTVHPFVDIQGQRWSVDPDVEPPEGVLPIPDDWELRADASEGGKVPLDDAAFLARDVCV